MELQFKNVTKDYGNVHAVEHVTHSMGKGVNGAGKTTLMRMICTAITPTSGEILWNGKDIFSLGASYREILGYLPQSYGFYPDLSVYDYMLYIASIKGIRPIMAKKRALKLLEQVGMAEKRKRKMRTLSGGMIRRVGIAQAMLNDPRILVLDEPTAGLDRNLISELSEDRLVLLSTHIVSDVEYVANEIILMKEGKFFYTGTSDEIILSMDMFVWNCIIPKSELNNYMKKYLIGNVRTVSDGVELRVLSKMPPTGNAVQVEATLEDAFLLYFGEKAGDKDDVQI